MCQGYELGNIALKRKVNKSHLKKYESYVFFKNIKKICYCTRSV